MEKIRHAVYFVADVPELGQHCYVYAHNIQVMRAMFMVSELRYPISTAPVVCIRAAATRTHAAEYTVTDMSRPARWNDVRGEHRCVCVCDAAVFTLMYGVTLDDVIA